MELKVVANYSPTQDDDLEVKKDEIVDFVEYRFFLLILDKNHFLITFYLTIIQAWMTMNGLK